MMQVPINLQIKFEKKIICTIYYQIIKENTNTIGSIINNEIIS